MRNLPAAEILSLDSANGGGNAGAARKPGHFGRKDEEDQASMRQNRL
jgi:hypothetical protein